MFAYVQAFLEQVLVSVACNGAHSLKQRLARWLLTMRDRRDDDALQTQNLLAEMLEVKPASWRRGSKPIAAVQPSSTSCRCPILTDKST